MILTIGIDNGENCSIFCLTDVASSMRVLNKGEAISLNACNF